MNFSRRLKTYEGFINDYFEDLVFVWLTNADVWEIQHFHLGFDCSNYDR